MDTIKTIAEGLFDAQLNIMVAESHLEEELDRIFGEDWPFDNYTYDYYDASIELKQFDINYNITDEQLSSILKLGFNQGWLVYRKNDYSKELFFYKKEGAIFRQVVK